MSDLAAAGQNIMTQMISPRIAMASGPATVDRPSQAPHGRTWLGI